jgi:hypothetical protein
MKKIILSFLLSFLVVGITMAQPPERQKGALLKGGRNNGPRPSKENLEALKVAFITRHLNLTADEAQIFWPAYNACFEELKKARQEKNEDVLAFEEADLKILKKYKSDFKKALGSDERVNKALTADRSFMGMLREELQNRKGGKSGLKNKGNGAPPQPPVKEEPAN